MDCAAAPVVCPRGQFRCGDDTCIDGTRMCDGVPNCVDKSDEANCDGVFCCADGTACIPSTWQNDRWPDCDDASDETEHALFSSYIYNMGNAYCRAVLPMCDIWTQESALSCSASILPSIGCAPAGMSVDAHTGEPVPSLWNNGQCGELAIATLSGLDTICCLV